MDETGIDRVGAEVGILAEKVTAMSEKWDLAAEERAAIKKELMAALDETKGNLTQSNDWIRKVEGMVAERASRGGDGVQADLFQAIPEVDRRQVALAAQYLDTPAQRRKNEGRKMDPVSYAAQALWLQKTLMLQGCQGDAQAVAKGPVLRGQIDTLNEAFGKDLLHQAALGETTSGTGVELILTPVESEILRQIQDNGMIRQVARVVPMVSKTHQIPSLETDVTATVTAEAAALTDSMAATNWAQKALTAVKIAGIARLSSELLQDNAVLLADFVFGAISEQIARLEDTEAIEGDGTNFTGVNAASGINSIAAAGADGDAVTLAKLATAVFTASDADSRGGGAAWFMNPLEAGMIFAINNGLNWQFPIGGAGSVMPKLTKGSLLGYPAFVHSGVLANRTKGSGTALTNVYFGNFDKLIVGDRMGVQFATDPFSLFTTDEIRLRVIKRTALLVGVPKSFTRIQDLTTA